MKLRLLFLTMMLALVSIVPAFAQESTDSAPLVFFGRGLRVMDETTRQVTEWDECSDGMGFHLSPTGEWLARLNGSSGLRLRNLKTRTVIDVAAPSVPLEHPFASYPAWSPDGAQVAWSVGETGSGHSLNVYDLKSGKARVLVVKLPSLSGIRPTVIWGQSGILVAVDSQESRKRIAPLYAPNGALRRANLARDEFFTSYFWATSESGKEYLGRYSNYVMGDLVDPESGLSYFADQIELYSPLAPDGVSVTMSFEPPGAFITQPDGKTVPIADLSPALHDFVPYLQFDPTNLAIAPDGQAVAFFDLDQLIWRDGKVTPIPNAVPSADGTGVFWGPMAHRIVGEVYSPIG